MRRSSALLVAGAVMLLLAAVPALAITNGEPDNGRHPFVGLMVADDADGNPLEMFGNLDQPHGVLDGGALHRGARCRGDDLVRRGRRGDPELRYAGRLPFEGDVDGTRFTHPDYDPEAFYLYDLGVVQLDDPVVMDDYGELPELGVLDGIKGADKKGALTAVGYGFQEINPNRFTGERDRLLATLDVLNTQGVFGVPKGTSVAVSGSGVGGDNSGSGGTCFGDSGGPQFLTDSFVVAAVTSFGINGNCAGTGGGYRVDAADDLDWLATFLK